MVGLLRWGIVKCKICDKYVKDLSRHLRTHSTPKSFECNVCAKTFPVERTLKNHMRQHAKKGPFKCDVCNKVFSSIIFLTRHIHTHADERPFKCDECDKSFILKDHLKTHMLSHIGDKQSTDDICDKVVLLKAYTSGYMHTHIEDSLSKCDSSDEGFSVKSKPLLHMPINTGKRIFSCDVCNKVFSKANNLRRHMRSYTAENVFKCDVCNKKFSSKSYLKKHNEKFYTCDKCHGRFCQLSDLLYHCCTNTKKIEFQCGISPQNELLNHTRPSDIEISHQKEIPSNQFNRLSTETQAPENSQEINPLSSYPQTDEKQNSLISELKAESATVDLLEHSHQKVNFPANNTSFPLITIPNEKAEIYFGKSEQTPLRHEMPCENIIFDSLILCLEYN